MLWLDWAVQKVLRDMPWSFEMLDISFYVKIMILLSSFPVIRLFPTLLPDLYIFFFLLSKYIPVLWYYHDQKDTEVVWPHREGRFQMSVSQGMKYKMPLGRQRSSFGRFPIQIYTARELCDSRILRQGKCFFSLVKIIHCLLPVSTGISIPCFCAHFCIPHHSTALHISNSFHVALWSMAATPSHQDLHWYIMLKHLSNKNNTQNRINLNNSSNGNRFYIAP